MEDKKEKLPSTNINWDSILYRKILKTMDISGF